VCELIKESKIGVSVLPQVKTYLRKYREKTVTLFPLTLHSVGPGEQEMRRLSQFIFREISLRTSRTSNPVTLAEEVTAVRCCGGESNLLSRYTGLEG